MSIEAKKLEILENFPDFLDWEEKYRFIIDFGNQLKPIPNDLKVDKFKVKGCQSAAWLVPEFKDGKVTFLADSEAAIVKGVLAVLVNVYSDETPEAILNLDPSFLKEAGIEDHLSINRRNGLANVMQLIRLYAEMGKAHFNKA